MFRTLTPGRLAFDLIVPVLLWFPTVLVSLGDGIASTFVATGMAAALVFWRWSPPVALTTAWGVALIQVGVGEPPHPANLAILPVLFGTAAYGGRVVRWLGLASAFAGAVVIAVSQTLRDLLPILAVAPDAVTRGWILGALLLFAAPLVAFLLSWTLGLLWRTWLRARDSRRQAQLAEREIAAEQERTRIARDMHDVVAHSLAVVVAQADGARYLGRTDPAATEEALVTIAATAREALADVRVLLAQLRHRAGEGPQPTLVDLERLYAHVRAAGLDVEEEVAGVPLVLGTGQQLAVYRIVQESLTNALRHGDAGRPVAVRFAWHPHGLDLTIASALPASARPVHEDAAPPHGIAGMTERAQLVGGRLTAGRDGDRFRVHAWLPAHPEPRPVPPDSPPQLAPRPAGSAS